MKISADDIIEQENSKAVKTNKDKDDSKVVHEDNLELSELKFSERQKIKRDRIKANMEGMNKHEKIKYLIMYFKWYGIISIIVLIATIYTGYCVYQGNRPIALSYAVVNCRDQEGFNRAFEEDYKETFGMTDKKYKLERDLDIFLGNPINPNDMEDKDYINVTKLSTMCFNDYFDVFIMDELGVKCAANTGILFPLTTYFSDDLYNKLKPYEYYAIDNDEQLSPVALDISDTEFAKSLNLYDKVYIGFAGREDTNYLNSLRMINYSLGLNLELTTDGRPKLK